MRTWQWGCSALAVSLLAAPGSAANGPARPIWAKAATPIDGWCRKKSQASELSWSPDRQWLIEFRCEGARENLLPHLRIRAHNGNWQELLFHRGNKPDYEYQGSSELLWSPDSQSFFINGAENGYTNYLLFYHYSPVGWHASDIGASARQDMVAIFPPCRAQNHNDEDCKNMERSPEHNMAGLAWTRGGKALIVMAEVPSVSSYGSIMGQVEGFELGVPGGQIMSRMTGRELVANWRHSMNWVPKIPLPPKYDAAPSQK